MDKHAIREKYTRRRSILNQEAIEAASLQIANQVLQLPIWEFTNYHIFLPIETKKEIDTSFILHILQGRDKSVIVPKTNFKTSELTHYLLQENTALQVSSYGIPEPVSGIILSPDQIEVVFVPLMAYDVKGNRIGYGKGFYDRFLSQCGPKTVFVGLSLFAAEQNIPHEENDIALHFCISPDQIYAF